MLDERGFDMNSERMLHNRGGDNKSQHMMRVNSLEILDGRFGFSYRLQALFLYCTDLDLIYIERGFQIASLSIVAIDAPRIGGKNFHGLINTLWLSCKTAPLYLGRACRDLNWKANSRHPNMLWPIKWREGRVSIPIPAGWFKLGL